MMRSEAEIREQLRNIIGARAGGAKMMLERRINPADHARIDGALAAAVDLLRWVLGEQSHFEETAAIAQKITAARKGRPS